LIISAKELISGAMRRLVDELADAVRASQK
jgi:hypothetical protein